MDNKQVAYLKVLLEHFVMSNEYSLELNISSDYLVIIICNYFYNIVSIWVLIPNSKRQPSNFFCPPEHLKT